MEVRSLEVGTRSQDNYLDFNHTCGKIRFRARSP